MPGSSLTRLRGSLGTGSLVATTRTPVTATLLTTGSINASQWDYVTDSISPTANALVVAFGETMGPGAPTVPASVTGAGLTFTRILDAVVETSWSHSSVWVACSASPSTGPITITQGDFSHTGIAWHIVEFICDADPVVNGRNAIMQAATSHATGANQSTTVFTGAWSGFEDDSNATVLLGVQNNDISVTSTPGSGLTELADTVVNLTGAGRYVHLCTNWANTAIVNPQYTNSSGAATNFACTYFLELKAKPAGGAAQDITGVLYEDPDSFGAASVARVGDFLSGSWTAGAVTTLSIAGGRARATATDVATNNPRIYKIMTGLTIGEDYRISGGNVYMGTTPQVYVRVSDDATVQAGGPYSLGETVDGTVQNFIFTATATTHYFGIIPVCDVNAEYGEITDAMGCYLEVAAGDQNITGALYNDPDTFGTAVVGRGAVNIGGVLYTDPDTFGTAIVTRGAVTITGVRYNDPDSFGSATVYAATLFTTLNPLDKKNVNVVLSNGDLTVTGNDPTNNWVRSTTAKAGKRYIEFTVTTVANTIVGISDLSALTFPGADAHSFGLFSNGFGSIAGAFPDWLTPYASGNVLCLAVDLTAKLVWWRVGAGNWNGSGTANPATGVGGFSIATYTGTPHYLVCSGDLNSVTTVNFGATAFANTVPASFSGWDLEPVQNITGVKYDDPDAFGTAVVTRGAVNITGTLYTDPDTFGTAVIGRGPVNITGVRYNDPDSFGTAVITRGAVTITGVRYNDPDTFGTAIVGRGAVNITGTRYVDPDFFGTAVISFPTPAAGITVWTGTEWADKPAKVWDGAAWMTKPAKTWNGSAWT